MTFPEEPRGTMSEHTRTEHRAKQRATRDAAQARTAPSTEAPSTDARASRPARGRAGMRFLVLGSGVTAVAVALIMGMGLLRGVPMGELLDAFGRGFLPPVAFILLFGAVWMEVITRVYGRGTEADLGPRWHRVPYGWQQLVPFVALFVVPGMLVGMGTDLIAGRSAMDALRMSFDELGWLLPVGVVAILARTVWLAVRATSWGAHPATDEPRS